MESRDLRLLSWPGVAGLVVLFIVAQPAPSLADEVPTPAAEEQAVPAGKEQAVPAGEEKPAVAGEPAPAGKPAAKGDSLDFDLFGDKSQAPQNGAALPSGAQVARDPLLIAKQVKRRRLILQLHQGFGFATLVTFAATMVLGQLNYIDKFGGGDYTNRYNTPHLGLAITTTALFATDGILALAAPNPYPKKIKADVALLHKVMMGLATAGMVAEIALGFVSASKGGELVQRDLALGHLVNGYVTFAAMTAGYLAYVF